MTKKWKQKTRNLISQNILQLNPPTPTLHEQLRQKKNDLIKAEAHLHKMSTAAYNPYFAVDHMDAQTDVNRLEAEIVELKKR